MAILLLILGIFFLVLLNQAFNRPQYHYPPDEFYHRLPERYYSDDSYYRPLRRSHFTEQLTAIINTVLFVLLLAAVLMYYSASNH